MNHFTCNERQPVERNLPAPPPRFEAAALELIVPFLNLGSACLSVRRAEALAAHLAVQIRVIAVQFVPFATAMEVPPVSGDYLVKALGQITSIYPLRREIYLTRSANDTWKAILAPESLVVLAAGMRGPFSAEARLARRLRKLGHAVCIPVARNFL